jgi:hypothetical protein
MRTNACATFGIVSSFLLLVDPRIVMAGPHDPRPSVAVRSGDASPVAARVPAACRGRLAIDAGDRLLFVDAAGTALFAESGGTIRTLAWTGQPVSESAVQTIVQAAAGGDGSIAFHARLADGRDGVLRIAAGETAAQPVALSGDTLDLPAHGVVALSLVSDPAVDGTGRVTVAVQTTSGAAAVVRYAPARPPEILIEAGTPLGGGVFARALAAPASTSAGGVVIVAALSSGGQAVLRLESGLPAATLVLAGDLSAAPVPRLDMAPPAVNDAGTVALLWSLPDGLRVERLENGAHLTVAAPGSPAPGGDSFAAVAALPPAVDAAGGVVFAAWRSAGPSGFYYTRDVPLAIAEEGMGDGVGGLFQAIDETEPGPAFAPSGEVAFALHDSLALPLDAAMPGGAVRTRARGGERLDEPARFATFVETSFPWLGGGPYLSPGGLMIFDARVTDGARGLFRRDPDGALHAVAMAGDPAPGGGHFDGAFFVYQSIDDRGDVAFLGVAPDTEAGTGLALYAGGSDGGGPVRVLGVGDSVPGSAAQLSGFLPPSPLNASGWLAIPAVLSDGSTVLLGFDGSHVFRAAGSGDVLPDGSIVAAIQTGVPSGQAVAPLLDGLGRVVVGLLLDDGRSGLFEMPLAEGGAQASVRLLGTGDAVQGGVLDPFQLQALARDDDGRLLFQATFDATRQFATFVQEGDLPARLAAPLDDIPGFGAVGSVFPHLAFAGGGLLVHAVAAGTRGGPEGLLLRLPAQPDPLTSLLLPGAGPIDGFGSPQPVSTTATRLASDRNGRVALAVGAASGPQGVLLVELHPNAPPVAAAGDDQTVECAGPDGAVVVLDGGGSADPDQDPLTYTWSGPFGTATGGTASVTVPLGTWAVTLEVTDPDGAHATDSVTVTVRDTTSPSLSLSASPEVLWPPDGSLVEVTVQVQTSDLCDPSPSIVLRGVQILDLGGSDAAADIEGADLGQDDRTIVLRATRNGGSGRLYGIIYLVMDHSGIPAIRSVAVRVPSHL